MSTQPQVPEAAPQMPTSMAEGDYKQTVLEATDEWSDARAYDIAKANFEYAERYKSQNCERRYRTSDDLYLAATTTKYWEGTKVKRSSMPIFTALSQIEGLIPHVVGALFNDGLPFNASPFPGTTMDQARATMQLIRWQMMWLDPNVGPIPFLSLRELFRRGYKSDLMYGNQIIEWGWLEAQRDRVRYEKHLVPERRMMWDQNMGPVMAPTGEMKWHVQTIIDKENISKPVAQHVDIRDFYWDPHCPSQLINEGRYCARRQSPTVSEMMQYAKVPGFNVPDKKLLLEIAKRKSQRQADTSKQYTETARGNSYNPIQEYNDNPNLCRLEVVRYFQKDRIVWIVPDEKEKITLYNKANEYLMLPFLTSCYTDVLGRWDGLSLCDLVEGDQKAAMIILDSRLDELNLLIHPPIVRRRGSVSSPSQKRLRPGAEWEVDGKPGEDVIRMEMGNVTAQAFVEVDAIDRRVQKTTGNSDLAVIGTASVGGNSANRTARGISAQEAASGTRIQYQVENKQDHILVPLIYVIHWLNKRFLDPAKTSEILGPDGAPLMVDHTDPMNAEVQFEMQAGSKMRAKQTLQSGGLQVILENIVNPNLIQQMATQGLKPNMKEIDALTCDALNLPQKSLWVPMSPQEQQSYQQQQQQSEMMRLQMQRERLQSAGDNQQEGNDTKLLLGLIQKLLTPDAAHAALGLDSPAKIAADHAPKQLPAKGSK